MIYGFNNFGYEGSLVRVEVTRKDGEGTNYAGLADGAVAETRERIKSAIEKSGYEYPNQKLLVTLSPVDLFKHDASYDLAIALSILDKVSTDEVLVIGELDLYGHVKQVKGTFAACQMAREAGITWAILPKGSPVPNGMKVIFTDDLEDAVLALEKKDFKEISTEMDSEIKFSPDNFDEVDVSLDDINNDFSNDLKFAMTVAVAGKHNLLVAGGYGKTKLLQSLPQIMPELTLSESVETTRIHSLAGLVKPNQNYLTKRPFRMPHQTATIEGICGGGPNCRSGEVSLAHNGVLFLDEASEFRMAVLQMLRVPVENHQITLSRAGRETVYPADFQLVMATSPCPCGNYMSKEKLCLCSQRSIENYWKKFSSSLLDRMDIRFNCYPEVKLTSETMTLARMRELITNAWTMQKKRNQFNGKRQFKYEEGPFIEDFFDWFENKADWKSAQDEEKLNSRKSLQILMLSRTLADMRMAEKITKSDIELAQKLRADTFLDLN